MDEGGIEGLAIAVAGVIIALLALWFAWPSFRRERDSRAEEEFQHARLVLVRDRARLVEAAAREQEDKDRIPDTPCITAANWILPAPILLDDVGVHFAPTRRSTGVTGRTDSATALLPRSLRRKGIDTYSAAIGHYKDLRPELYWNGLSYDLRQFDVDHQGGVQLTLGLANFFEMLDVCESLAHEFSIGKKSLRRAVGDPVDLSSRVCVPALTWLLLIKEPDGTTTFALHARDAKAVASDGAFKHVFGGQVQPSSEHVVDAARDASLWANFAREFSEELLGVEDAEGHSGSPIDYSEPPYSTLRQLADDGGLSVSLVGLGIDPLSYWPSLLAVAVGVREQFSARLPGFVSKNSEGVVVSECRQLRGFEFTRENVDRLCDDLDVGVAAKGCLRLAWNHRHALKLS